MSSSIPKFGMNPQFGAYSTSNKRFADQRRFGGGTPYGYPAASLSDDQFSYSADKSKVKTGLYITGGILATLIGGGFALKHLSPQTYENIAKVTSENVGKYMPTKATELVQQCSAYGSELMGKVKSSNILETATNWFKSFGKK